jgi:hypothetical protein
MSFDIAFDYRFDTVGFFDNADARAALEEAARLWEEAIGDEFDTVPAGVSFHVSDPSTGSTELVTLQEDIDDILIFMGASDAPFGIGIGEDTSLLPEGVSCDCALCAGSAPAGALARAGYSGTSAAGDAFAARVSGDFRGQGPVTDFEPWAGVFGVNTSYDWSFDLAGPAPGQFDFLTVALHEIGHALGLGTAPAFDALASGDSFTGPNATAANGGAPVPLDAGGAHVEAGHAGDTVVMDPSIAAGQRIALSGIDLGLLADIGYQVPGMAAQGASPAITTEGADAPVFGRVVADLIDGLGGADQLQGAGGDDTLLGGAGADTLFGQAGNDMLSGGADGDVLQGGAGGDTLAGGAGADTLWGEGGIDLFSFAPGDGLDRIADMDLGGEAIRLSSAFGFGSVDEVLQTITKPFSNVTRLQLDPTTAVDIFHDSRSGSPVEARHILLEEAASPSGPPPFPDFDGDGTADLLLGNASGGQKAVWFMDSAGVGGRFFFDPPGWDVATTGDFDGDGRNDIILHNPGTGAEAIWRMEGGGVADRAFFDPPGWDVATTGDFDGDGRTDLVLHNAATGAEAIWRMDGLGVADRFLFDPPGWDVEATGDFDGDGRTDLLLHNRGTGAEVIWFMDGLDVSGRFFFDPPGWDVETTGDFNGDGATDLALANADTGAQVIWEMAGGSVADRFFFDPEGWDLVAA